MDLGIIAPIFSAIAAMAAATRVFFEFSFGGKARLREEYKFAKEFLHDLETNEGLHPLAVERGYLAIAGTTRIKSDEIAYLIELENPSLRLKDYVLARRYVELRTRSLRIDFKKKYSKPFSRIWRKTAWVTLYFIASALAMGPFLAVGIFHLPLKYYFLLLMTLPTFGFFAVDALRMAVKLKRAEDLVKAQRKHTPLITLKK